MRRKPHVPALAVLLALAGPPAAAQVSASYEASETVLNGGGAPAGSPASTSYRVSLVAIGDGTAAGVDPSSASFRVSVGFVGAYPPPGEVTGLRFDDATSLSWSVERSAGRYNLYRDPLGAIAGLGYGSCEQQGLTSPSATDGDTPPAGDGYFYLVSAENRLREEGTKGLDSGGGERSGNVCP